MEAAAGELVSQGPALWEHEKMQLPLMTGIFVMAVLSSLAIVSRTSSPTRKIYAYRADEFGGPLGCFLIISSLPLLVIFFHIVMQHHEGHIPLPSSWDEFSSLYLAHFPSPSWAAAKIYGLWFSLQVLLQLFCPGETVFGVPLPQEQGRRLPYKMNGWCAMCITFSGFLLGAYFGLFKGGILVDHLGELVVVATIFAYTLSALLYLGHKVGAFGWKMERETSSDIFNFFLGGSVNPRIGNFDLKCFCESRPGLMFWVLINWSFCFKQYEELGTVTPSLLAVSLFQTWYIVDYFWQEEAILTTMDIMHDKFGFMLCYGDLAFVPFSYSLQAFYLWKNPQESLGYLSLCLLVVLNFFGYYLFRSANNQKHTFRSSAHPERERIWGRAVRYVQTERGTRLLASGWWGLSRHPNYLGDWLMGLAWCLCCGCGALLPHFYAIYFAVLLVHRERRDNQHCRRKYGRDWDAYCQLVPYRIVPGLY